jgi:hypothetical protein
VFLRIHGVREERAQEVAGPLSLRLMRRELLRDGVDDDATGPEAVFGDDRLLCAPEAGRHERNGGGRQRDSVVKIAVRDVAARVDVRVGEIVCRPRHAIGPPHEPMIVCRSEYAVRAGGRGGEGGVRPVLRKHQVRRADGSGRAKATVPQIVAHVDDQDAAAGDERRQVRLRSGSILRVAGAWLAKTVGRDEYDAGVRRNAIGELADRVHKSIDAGYLAECGKRRASRLSPNHASKSLNTSITAASVGRRAFFLPRPGSPSSARCTNTGFVFRALPE